MSMNRIKQIQYLKKLKNYIMLDKRLVAMLAVFRFLNMIVALCPPFVYQFYINKVVVIKDISNMVYVVLGYIALFIAQGVLLSFSKYYETKYMNEIRINTKRKVFDIISGMKYVVYEQNDPCEFRMRAEEDVEIICSFYLEHCLNFFYSIIYAICIVVILFFMNVYLTLFGIVMIALSFFITRVLVAKIMIISKKYRTDQSDFDATMYDGLQNWKEIKINCIEDKQIDLLCEKWSCLSESKLKHTKYKFLHGALVAFNLFFVTRMNLYFFGGLLVIYKLMVVPTMLVFMNYYEQLYSNIQTILNSMVNLGIQIPQINNILMTLSQVESDTQVDETITINDLKGDVVVSDISFKYEKSERNVLNHVSLEIKKNQSYTIIGESGSGKTTLLKLLVGLYSPDHGKILLNHYDLEAVPSQIKKKYINIVMQDPQFFNMTILDNLLLADENASLEKIEEVCKNANIYDFIQSLPDKYHTVIGENGIKLSGGQKQRLAIARTLLLEPQILIFDEATSALDSENEEMIVKAIDNIAKKMTVIVISHRYSTIAHCDHAIFIQNGEVKEQGLLKQIINTNGIVHELFGQELHE